MIFHSLREFGRYQIALITGDENRWFTGERVGHDPTERELVNHWIDSGAAARFAEEHKIIKE